MFDRGKWGFVGFTGRKRVLAVKLLGIYWRVGTGPGKAKDAEISNFFKAQYFQHISNGALLKPCYEKDNVELLVVEVIKISVAVWLERLGPIAWFIWYYWRRFCIYSRTRAYLEIIFSIHSGTTLFELGSTGFRWARRGVNWYDWCEVFLYKRDVGLFGAPSWKVWSCDIHFRIIDLVLFMRLFHAVCHWLTMRLFSVTGNIVHFWARYELVQCVWLVCSYLDLSCDSSVQYHYDIDFYGMMEVSLLEVIQDSRMLIRNHPSACVPMEADLVVEQIAKASVDRSRPLAWVS